MDLYNVVFEGKILPGKNINAVKAEFAQLFKVSSEKKLNSFFSGHPVVLKKSISLEQADKYELALLKVGAYCQNKLIEVEKPVQPINFECTQVEESPAAVDDELVEADDSGTTGDAVAQEVNTIEFEYGAVESLEAPAADEIVETEEENNNSEPVNRVSLADLSLVELEEKESEDDDDN